MRELPRTITETAQRLRAKDVSALELADAFLEAARADPFNAWLHLAEDHARRQATAADAKLRAGDAPLLTGVPWACKDIIGTKDIVTTAASKILAGYRPAYSATVVRESVRYSPRAMSAVSDAFSARASAMVAADCLRERPCMSR